MVTSSLKMVHLRKVVLLTCCLSGFAAIQQCYAQSLVGKWKQVSGKMFCTPEAVKKSHGHLQEVMDMPKVEAVDEFKADNTLTETITSGTTKTSATGTWAMSGKTVTIHITGHNPMTGIVSDGDKTLIYTVEMPKSEHMQVSKREWTFSRI
ncbi:MAG TPA: hypothetical protein VGZ71_02835 [Puia sp.]|jgi:hypothetical protein|nr:hypothetical protein [Puia sp.]